MSLQHCTPYQMREAQANVDKLLSGDMPAIRYEDTYAFREALRLRGLFVYSRSYRMPSGRMLYEPCQARIGTTLMAEHTIVGKTFIVVHSPTHRTENTFRYGSTLCDQVDLVKHDGLWLEPSTVASMS